MLQVQPLFLILKKHNVNKNGYFCKYEYKSYRQFLHQSPILPLMSKSMDRSVQNSQNLTEAEIKLIWFFISIFRLPIDRKIPDKCFG